VNARRPVPTLWTHRRRPRAPRGALVVLALGLLALGASTAAQPAAGPIRIALLMPGSGPFQVNGQRVTTGVRLFFQSKDWQVAGRKLELVTEDTHGDPQVALTKTRKVVESDNVHAIIGYITTPATYAVRDYLTGRKVPTLAVSAANGLVHPGSPQRSPYMFRSYISYYGIGKALAGWVHARGGHRKVILVASNFGGALEPAFAFRTTYTRLGGQVVAEVKPPVGTVDWGPWLSQVERAAGGAEAVIAMVYGADAVRMVQAWSDTGLKGRLPLYGGEAFVSEMLLPAMGAAAEGIRQLDSYCPAADTAENREFVRLVKATGQYPAENTFYGWTAAQTLWEALHAIGGQAQDAEALVAALARVRYVGPMGPFHYDEQHSPVLDAYVQEVRKVDGELHNACLERVPAVSHPGDIPFPPR
jgi:branched-chain amino acid transport system substrate-binding protein